MITKAVGGCGYVSFTWTDNSSEICTYKYYVQLRYGSERRSVITPNTWSTFNEQPYDTQFNFTVHAFSPSDVGTTTSNQAHASVRTLPVEGICMHTYAYICMHIYMNVYTYVYIYIYICTYIRMCLYIDKEH